MFCSLQVLVEFSCLSITIHGLMLFTHDAWHVSVNPRWDTLTMKSVSYYVLKLVSFHYWPSIVTDKHVCFVLWRQHTILFYINHALN